MGVWRALLVLASARWCEALTKGGRVVVLGQGASEVKMITAKLAAKAGYEAVSVVTGSNDQLMWQCRAMMYGRDYAAAGVDEAGKAYPIMGVEAIGDALQEAQGVVLCFDEKSGPPNDKYISVLFDVAASPKLKSVAMLSKIGGGGPDIPVLSKSLAPLEKSLKQVCANRGLPLSIVRAGILKGGGPGEVSRAPPDAGKSKTDYGLDVYFYSTLFDIGNAMTTMSHDTFALGASITNGDPFKPSNPIAAFGEAGDFAPRKTDANRVNVASALLAAVARGKDADFTVSCEEANAPPTMPEWTQMVQGLP